MRSVIIEDLKSSVSIIDYAKNIGLTPIKIGTHYYTLKEHDSVRIDPISNMFIRNSTRECGSIIDFAVCFKGLNLREAILDIDRYKNGSVSNKVEKPREYKYKEKEKKKFELPFRSKSIKNVYAYLLNTRKIEKEIVDLFLKKKMLYQDDRKNCVFVSYNKEGKAVFANKRSANTYSSFKQDVSGCDYSHSFFIDNQKDKLVVCESVIDVMSYMSLNKLYKKEYMDASYLAISGLYKYKEALSYHLNNESYKEVKIAFDNDEKGKELAREAISYISEINQDIIATEDFPFYLSKDYNEFLQKTHEKGTYEAIRFDLFKKFSNLNTLDLDSEISDLKKEYELLEKLLKGERKESIFQIDDFNKREDIKKNVMDCYETLKEENVNELSLEEYSLYKKELLEDLIKVSKEQEAIYELIINEEIEI